MNLTERERQVLIRLIDDRIEHLTRRLERIHNETVAGLVRADHREYHALRMLLTRGR
jgi:hypothetical protein